MEMQHALHSDAVATAAGVSTIFDTIEKSIFSYRQVSSTCTCQSVVNDAKVEHRSTEVALGGKTSQTQNHPSGVACLSS
jgi:hypothetical protein